ncbi:hypothetical protein PsorP6_014622 [Peronosclerospora sorghi]|uniref:Uncharacterized protein n=1 Tax=Peronosclerospora sorghi TaxID=230839 RepID=A0ACC0VT31_9STRA|nr:hypothetical protein PsorP6_014622 [Peronosclerospora sorghi]
MMSNEVARESEEQLITTKQSLANVWVRGLMTSSVIQMMKIRNTGRQGILYGQAVAVCTVLAQSQGYGHYS